MTFFSKHFGILGYAGWCETAQINGIDTRRSERKVVFHKSHQQTRNNVKYHP